MSAGRSGSTGSGASRRASVASKELRTRELSETTWPAFEKLFARYGGVQAGCWCMFYHRSGPNHAASETERQEANRRDHRALVREGRGRGVVVYEDGEPVGWCQFGRADDLPRVAGGRKYRSLALGDAPPRLWRITCFFVDKGSRRRGVAKVALHAALGAIARAGGGVVEAFPVTHPGAVAVWFGSVSMFRREGFREVAPFGASQRLVRRAVPAASGAPSPGSR